MLCNASKMKLCTLKLLKGIKLFRAYILRKMGCSFLYSSLSRQGCESTFLKIEFGHYFWCRLSKQLAWLSEVLETTRILFMIKEAVYIYTGLSLSPEPFGGVPLTFWWVLCVLICMRLRLPCHILGFPSTFFVFTLLHVLHA
jgi:hypothetical protein